MEQNKKYLVREVGKNGGSIWSDRVSAERVAEEWKKSTGRDCIVLLPGTGAILFDTRTIGESV